MMKTATELLTLHEEAADLLVKLDACLAKIRAFGTPLKLGVVVGAAGSVFEGLDSGKTPTMTTAPWCSACWHSVSWNPHPFNTQRQRVSKYQDPAWKHLRYCCDDCNACSPKGRQDLLP